MLVDNIERLCKEKGVSICAMEKASGIANGTVWKWKNKARPSARIETINKIADYFGVTVDELLKQNSA